MTEDFNRDASSEGSPEKPCFVTPYENGDETSPRKVVVLLHPNTSMIGFSFTPNVALVLDPYGEPPERTVENADAHDAFTGLRDDLQAISLLASHRVRVGRNEVHLDILDGFEHDAYEMSRIKREALEAIQKYVFGGQDYAIRVYDKAAEYEYESKRRPSLDDF